MRKRSVRMLRKRKAYVRLRERALGSAKVSGVDPVSWTVNG
jgi:hypothetical protein